VILVFVFYVYKITKHKKIYADSCTIYEKENSVIFDRGQKSKETLQT